MHPQVQTLYELQQIDKKIASSQDELTELDQGDAEKAEAERLKGVLVEFDEALTSVKTDLKDAELALQATEGDLKKYRDKLYGGTVANPKELEDLEKEVSMLSRTRSKIDEKILNLMDTEDKRQAEVDECKRALEETEGVRAQKVEAYNKRKAEIEAALAEAAKEREKISRPLDPDLFERYEDMRQYLSNLAVAAVIDGACEGCHITVPEFQMRDFEESEALQKCQCGRILHLTGQSE